MNYQNQRKIYGQTLVELGNENKDIVVLDAEPSQVRLVVLYSNEVAHICN